MNTLNRYAHCATEQQRKSMVGAGIPLDFIRDIETGNIDIDEAVKNVKTHVFADTLTEFHTADVHCALAAVHFVIAKRDGHTYAALEEIRNAFIKEMNLFFSFGDKDLESRLRHIVTTAH